MLEKDAKKRINMEQIINNDWINEGRKITLQQEIQMEEAEIKEIENLRYKLKDPIFTIAILKIVLRRIRVRI